MQGLRVVRVRLGLREVVDGADAAPPPHYGRFVRIRLLAVGEIVQSVQFQMVPQFLVLPAVRRDEMRGPDERDPPLSVDAVEHSLGIWEVPLVELVGTLMGKPSAVHHVHAARKTALRQLPGVVVRRLLVHSVEEYLDPVVPLRKREENVGWRLPLEAHVRLRRREVCILQRRAGLDALDLLRIGVDNEFAVLEFVAERLLAPDVASERRHQERR